MTNEKTAADIETEIAQERRALAESLSELTEQFSPEKLVETVSETIKTHGGDVAETLVRGVRENPVAVGLVGAGLAWLVLGGASATKTKPSPATYDTTPRPTAGGFAEDTDPQDFTARVEAADAAIRKDRFTEEEPSAFERARTQVARSAAKMRETLYDGTAELSDVARARVIEARQKAISAQARIEAAASRASAGGQKIFAEHPLLVGAAVAVVGAAAAMALPRTQIEDEQFGAHRDALLAEAERVWHEEVARAKRMGEAALDEAKTMAAEAAEDLPDGEEAVATAENKLRDAGERVVARAKDAARH
ncbi:DUF3618 domain-containing protein [Rhodophyticola sp.]|jgi:hypothetical protein|uniref:DUF3618 domain-containing protein n=1 Tax=Rhodophyticola sp. TaxID=2680032 RepID=UPI003D294B94